ncbi:MAG TPA: CRISPR-associated protein Cas4 [Candidatus Copromorpha excrementigallinarum]|uniref:CRISPR-associated exonuclease Cas4 n=1 Tax=Candidatus Allocopromorpha excrementigallinarum TaxID=2840742 RepID=A0A9D1I0V4_9FIRM|nr:CRISPR-associated protein Cas4 [Candidatus Copromorpha excrementigallinarum]
MEYREEDFLQLSGIQHFAFCPRQWALIHIEQQWADNLRTVEGNIIHERAHEGQLREKRGSVIISRGMSVFSRSLGISGICDVVEFHRSPQGTELFGEEGKYQVLPVEYKKGVPKEGYEDVLQLAAQAMCLEEMLACRIERGFLYYGETRRRLEVRIDEEIRRRTEECCRQMHRLYERGNTPKVKPSKRCNACSLKDICMPRLSRNKSVVKYIDDMIRGGGE